MNDYEKLTERNRVLEADLREANRRIEQLESILSGLGTTARRYGSSCELFDEVIEVTMGEPAQPKTDPHCDGCVGEVCSHGVVGSDGVHWTCWKPAQPETDHCDGCKYLCRCKGQSMEYIPQTQHPDGVHWICWDGEARDPLEELSEAVLKLAERVEALEGQFSNIDTTG